MTTHNMNDSTNAIGEDMVLGYCLDRLGQIIDSIAMQRQSNTSSFKRSFTLANVYADAIKKRFPEEDVQKSVDDILSHIDSCHDTVYNNTDDIIDGLESIIDIR